MKIAILGWGSLIWNPGELKTSGDWQYDGPHLPIEFARVSGDQRLTLVIRPNSKKVKTLYTTSSFSDLQSAIENLQIREKCTDIKKIGYLDFVNNSKI
jgi:hypothetical protein